MKANLTKKYVTARNEAVSYLKKYFKNSQGRCIK